MTWQASAENDLVLSFASRLHLFTHGEGSYLWDDEGKRYLDFLGGIAVTALGHAHPVFVTALTEQAGRVSHVSNYFATQPQLDLAVKLKEIAGTGEGGRVYFANSGAEANEAAFKLARIYGGQNRPRVLALRDGFHGRTMGSLSLTYKEAIRQPFEPLVPGVEFIDSSIEALEVAMGDDVAALFVEPIKGEAGVAELPEGFLAAAREITSRYGALLIVDEVQTGSGRTGDWFAFQSSGVVPDAVTVAKGMGGGFPIGALITFGAASDLFTPGSHGSTYGGNPLACAVSLAVLNEIDSADLLANASERGEKLRAGILALNSELISGVSGRGLLLGVRLSGPYAQRLRALTDERGLIINAASDDVVRLAPALNIGDAEVAEFFELFSLSLADLAVELKAQEQL